MANSWEKQWKVKSSVLLPRTEVAQKLFKHLTHTFVFTTAAYTEKKSKIDGKKFLQVIFCYYLFCQDNFYFCSTHLRKLRPRNWQLSPCTLNTRHDRKRDTAILLQNLLGVGRCRWLGQQQVIKGTLFLKHYIEVFVPKPNLNHRGGRSKNVHMSPVRKHRPSFFVV